MRIVRYNRLDARLKRSGVGGRKIEDIQGVTCRRQCCSSMTKTAGPRARMTFFKRAGSCLYAGSYHDNRELAPDTTGSSGHRDNGFRRRWILWKGIGGRRDAFEELATVSDGRSKQHKRGSAQRASSASETSSGKPRVYGCAGNSGAVVCGGGKMRRRAAETSALPWLCCRSEGTNAPSDT